MTMHWTDMSPDEKLRAVAALLKRDGGLSARQISEQFPGSTRNAVIGVVHRSGGEIRLRARGENRPPPRRARPKGSPDRRVKLGRHMTDAELFSAPAWRPLPGSNPVDLLSRTGCAWPVTVDGKVLFCNCEVEEGSYCPEHTLLKGNPYG